MSDENTPGGEPQGSLLPAALGGAGILIAAALLIFWPTGSESDPAKNADGTEAGASAATNDKKARTGGVKARQVDEPGDASRPEVRRNPAVQLPRGIGMSPNAPEPTKPPKFETKDQEIDWHREQLVQAESQLKFRQTAHGRLDRMRTTIEQGPNPKEGLEDFETRKKIVEKNLELAEQRVAELNKKIAELGG